MVPQLTAVLIASLAALGQCRRVDVELHSQPGIEEAAAEAANASSQGTFTCDCDGQQVMRMGNMAAVSLDAHACLQKCGEMGAREYCVQVTGGHGTRGKKCHPVPPKEEFCVKTKCEAGVMSFGQCTDTFDVTETVEAYKSNLVGGYFARKAARQCSGWCSATQDIDDGACPHVPAQRPGSLMAIEEAAAEAANASSQGKYTCDCDGQQVIRMGGRTAGSLGAHACLEKCEEMGAREYCVQFTSVPVARETRCHPVPPKEKFCVKTKCESGVMSFGQCTDTFDVAETVEAFKSNLVGSYFALKAARQCSGWCTTTQDVDDGACPHVPAQKRPGSLMAIEEAVAEDANASSQGTYTCDCDGQQVMRMGNMAAISLGAHACLEKCGEMGAREYCVQVTGGHGTRGKKCHPVPPKEKFCAKTKCEAGVMSFGQCTDTFDVTETVEAYKSNLVGAYFARKAARECSGWCSTTQDIDDGACPV